MAPLLPRRRVLEITVGNYAGLDHIAHRRWGAYNSPYAYVSLTKPVRPNYDAMAAYHMGCVIYCH